MSKRGLGLVLVLTLAVAVGAAAVFQDFRFDRALAQERVSAEQVSRRLESTPLSIANPRGAQAGYLSVGQGPEFWMKRARELSAVVQKNLRPGEANDAFCEAGAD